MRFKIVQEPIRHSQPRQLITKKDIMEISGIEEVINPEEQSTYSLQMSLRAGRL